MKEDKEESGIQNEEILNDKLNSINNFEFENVENLKTVNVISNDLYMSHMKSVDVFYIVKKIKDYI